MTPQYQHKIPAPMAWRGAEIRREDITVELSPRQVAGLEEVLGRIEKAGLPLREIGPAQARHPTLDATLEKIWGCPRKQPDWRA